ncbi:hypothetical protein GQ44DRAFT_609124 [Phaeosphaeriaceae sp. PMI808]|nr:hypothetical protein GQ44DRAFT_609124 [Phaeosphaeriaceae sp. PMI808]
MEFPIGKAFYPCETQHGRDDTFGMPPPRPEFTNHKGNDLVVGLGPIIPRWIASTSSPTNLLYFVIREGFPNEEDFEYSATAFQEAADEWNNIGFGLKISRTTDKALAHFAIRYTKPAIDRGTLASAFFPNDVQDVLVYNKTLVEPKWRVVLKNSFLHEIGHIVGLRHEFAIKKDRFGHGPEGEGAIQFGSENPLSVMSYEDVNYIRDTDRNDVKEFYKLPNNYEIGGVKIWDYVPTPLTP